MTSEHDMTREEQLEMENVQLKLLLANQEVQGLMAQRSGLMRRIAGARGIEDPEHWTFDVGRGKITRLQVAGDEEAAAG